MSSGHRIGMSGTDSLYWSCKANAGSPSGCKPKLTQVSRGYSMTQADPSVQGLSSTGYGITKANPSAVVWPKLAHTIPSSHGTPRGRIITMNLCFLRFIGCYYPLPMGMMYPPHMVGQPQLQPYPQRDATMKQATASYYGARQHERDTPHQQNARKFGGIVMRRKKGVLIQTPTMTRLAMTILPQKLPLLQRKYLGNAFPETSARNWVSCFLIPALKQHRFQK